MGMNLKEDKKAYAIMGCAMRLHRILGDGFLESAYGDALEVEFARNGIPYVREDDLRVFYDVVPPRRYSTTEEVWRKLPPDENNATEGRQGSG